MTFLAAMRVLRVICCQSKLNAYKLFKDRRGVTTLKNQKK